MTSVGALQAFGNNKPLQTIEESANSEYESSIQGESRLLQYQDIYYNQAVKLAAEEWHSSTSEALVSFDEGRASPRTEARLRSPIPHFGPRTR
jgi:adenosine deaminase